MPLHETTAGREHTAMRCDTLSQSELRLRISRIRNPQKMFEFVCELRRRRNGSTFWERLYLHAVDVLAGMGYDGEGVENGNPVSRWSPATAPRLGRTRLRRTHVAVNTPRIVPLSSELRLTPSWDLTPSFEHYKIVLAPAALSLPGNDLVNFINVLRDHAVPFRIIAMSLGKTVTEMKPILYGIGWTKKQVEDVVEESEILNPHKQVRRITLRKENK